MYAEGNFIEKASDTHPYLQTGEATYGKADHRSRDSIPTRTLGKRPSACSFHLIRTIRSNFGGMPIDLLSTSATACDHPPPHVSLKATAFSGNQRRVSAGRSDKCFVNYQSWCW